ncbi:MAG: hypothetical protein WCK43_06285 [bacterium]
MNFKKISLIIFFIVLAIGLVPFLYDQLIVGPALARWKVENVEPIKQKAIKALPQFKEDLKSLQPKLEFLKSKRVKDAGPFLNPRMNWKFKDKGTLPQEWESKVDKSQVFSITESLKNNLKDLNNNFLEANVIDFSQVDTEWIHKLRDYDYWNIDKNSPLEAESRYTLVNSPTLNPLEVDFIKIHLIKAKVKSDDEYIEAIRDVLHFAHLSFSTESREGMFLFFITLGIAKIASDARTGVLEKLGPWNVLLDESEKKRFLKVFALMDFFARPGFAVDLETMREIYKDQKFSTGICAVIRYGTQFDKDVWSAVSDAMPLEYREFKRLILEDSAGCRLTWIKEKAPPWVRLPSETSTPYAFNDSFAFYDEKSDKMPFFNYVKPFFRFIFLMPKTRAFIGSMYIYVLTPDSRFLKYQ